MLILFELKDPLFSITKPSTIRPLIRFNDCKLILFELIDDTIEFDDKYIGELKALCGVIQDYLRQSATKVIIVNCLNIDWIKYHENDDVIIKSNQRTWWDHKHVLH